MEMYDEDLKWITPFDKPWHCPHVNKCDVLVNKGHYVYIYNTDYPEPERPYMYIFMNNLLEGYEPRQNRNPLQCNCI